METRCPRWYQTNVGALGVGELRRATGGGAGFWLTLPLYLVSKLLRRRLLSRNLVPEEITAIVRREVEIPVPEPVRRLGFAPLLTLSLPEFSGRNLVHMLVDEPRHTVWEFIVAWDSAAGDVWRGAEFILCSALEDGRLLRTITSPRSYPVRPPPRHRVVVAEAADPAALYARHRNELRELSAATGSPPVVFDEESCIAIACRSHGELVAHQLRRGVFVEAAPQLVEALFRDNDLTRPAAEA